MTHVAMPQCVGRSRTDGLPPPIHMCDGLSANNLSEDAVVANYMDHAQRKFYDLHSSYKEEVNYILSEMQKVYLVYKEAKKLSPGERLAMHRDLSKPTMDSLHQWMLDQFQSCRVEPNSPLGKAITYCLKRWTELTRFLDIPGVPLSNSETEQAIKWAICHRKNSLFYKTQNGPGTVILSSQLSKPATALESIASITSWHSRRTALGSMNRLSTGCPGTIGPISDLFFRAESNTALEQFSGFFKAKQPPEIWA